MAHILDDSCDYGVSLRGRRDGGRRTPHFLYTLRWPASDRTTHDGAIWYSLGFLYQEYAGQLCYCLLQTEDPTMFFLNWEMVRNGKLATLMAICSW